MCRINAIFGVPGKGIHAPRLFGMAAVDLLLTAAAALVIAMILRPGGAIFETAAIAFTGLMLVAICVHWLFGVKTALNVALGRLFCK